MRPQLLVLPLAALFLLLSLVVGIFRLFAMMGLMDNPPLAFMFHAHGEMLIFAFLAVLIVTERYIGSLPFALNRSVHAMPFLVSLGAILKMVGLLIDQPSLNIAGSIILAVGLVIYLYLLYTVGRQSAQPLPLRFMMLGAALLLVGVLISPWRPLVGNLPFTLFLLGFPTLTILGERVELSRFLSPGAQRWMRWSLWLVMLAFLLLLLRVFWSSALFLGIWSLLMALAVLPLIRGELTLTRVAKGGLYLYLGRHLTLSYFWLFLSLVLVGGYSVMGHSQALLDASIHSMTVGFIGTMILAHAPVIAPALLNRAVLEEKLSLLPAVLLAVGNGVRLAGYLLRDAGLPLGSVVAGSGVLILAALVLFALVMVRSLRPA